MGKYSALKSLWGYEHFRPGQEELIDGILAGRDVVGILPTGAGKSLCYQIPAVLSGGTTLVVSPLISLMSDQVASLIQSGVKAAYLNSSLTERQYREALKRLSGGAYKIVYIAPERLASENFLNSIQQVPIDMVTVDEAHCISQWGHDFRPSYSKIVEFVNSLPYRPVISAFTATATAQVQSDIINTLKLHRPLVTITGFDRPNLYFEVQRRADKMSALMELLDKQRGKNGVIYCATRKAVEEVCDTLTQAGLSATRYHAGLSDMERKINQDDFLYDRKQIMVATNAFGMGIDKSNVSFVVHYNMPKNIESYYQEAGRAGRDGEPAQCTILYSGQDVYTNRFLIENSSDFNEELSDEMRRKIKQKEHEKLKFITFYCTGTSCLREYILKYFGEAPPNFCGNCTNCQTGFEHIDITAEAQEVVSCVMQMADKKGMFGKVMLVDMLKGKQTERIRRYGFDTLPSYGVMADTPERNIRAIVDFLLREEYLSLSVSEYPVIDLSDRWDQMMKDGAAIEMRLPKEKKETRSRKVSVISGAEETLFHKLKSLRSRLAAEAGIPAYIIFTDASLRDMCIKLPQTDEEFLSVSGVGRAKLEKYGEEFTAAIKEYMNSGDATPRPEELPAAYTPSKSYRGRAIETRAKQASHPWTAREEEGLKCRYLKRMPVPALAGIHKRTRGDILSKLKELGLVEESDFPQGGRRKAEQGIIWRLWLL